ncbi:3200_t:CDS:2 [Ambispora gerdemannii]|uniref:BLOC-1-related complex subunit 5 n=1 Tax=Ambispora gerdemannii TaxID=144530 RepID=A0A9N8YM83_9GLOM|nr:3200_t:CDS:2 [Ambispora gerdemannii]
MLLGIKLPSDLADLTLSNYITQLMALSPRVSNEKLLPTTTTIEKIILNNDKTENSKVNVSDTSKDAPSEPNQQISEKEELKVVESIKNELPKDVKYNTLSNSNSTNLEENSPSLDIRPEIESIQAKNNQETETDNIDSNVPDVALKSIEKDDDESLKNSHAVIEKEDSHSLSIKRDIEKGVITLSSVNSEVSDLDPEIIKLDQIPKFEPLIKPNLENSGYSFSNLWGGSSASASAVDSDTESFFRHESMFKIASLFQSPMRRYAEEICEDQRVIIDTVKSVDEYCAQISQSMFAAQLQAKTNLEQISIVNSLMKQVEKTHVHIHDTFQTLNKLDKLLSEDMQLGSTTATERWPTIHKLFAKTRPRPPQHGGSFQFETKRLSLQQRRTYPSAVAVTFDTVLSARHQDGSLPDSLIPEKQQQPVVINDAPSSLPQQRQESENTSEQVTTASAYSSSPWSISLSPIREGLKRVGSSTGIDTLLWSSSPAPAQNSNSGLLLSKPPTTSTFTTSQSSAGISNSNSSINSKDRSTKDRKKMKLSSKDSKENLTPGIIENEATSTVSSSATDLIPPTHHSRTPSESSNISNNSSVCDEIYMKSTINKSPI